MTLLLLVLLASGCAPDAGPLATLGTAVADASQPSEVTVTARLIGTFEDSDGYQWTTLGEIYRTQRFLLSDILEFDRAVDISGEGFRMVTRQGNFIAEAITVHVPGKGDADFRPVVYGYPTSAEGILPAANRLIDWQNRPRGKARR